MLVNVCPDDVFRTTKHFVTKLGIVMRHHEPECMQKDWFAIVKVTARAYADQNMTVSTTSSELLILLLPNLV